MKITKKANLALLVMLTAVSILPGCGKSKNNEQIGIIGGPVGAPPPGFVPAGGSNGCAQIAAAGDGSMTFPVAGAAYIGITGFSAQAYVGGSGYSGGNYYHRINASGDSVDVSLSGTPNSNGAVAGTVHLSPTTVMALGGPNTFCVQGVLFNNTGITAGSPGMLYAGMYLYTSRGAIGL